MNVSCFDKFLVVTEFYSMAHTQTHTYARTHSLRAVAAAKTKQTHIHIFLSSKLWPKIRSDVLLI